MHSGVTLSVGVYSSLFSRYDDFILALTKSLAFGFIVCLCNDLFYSGCASWFKAESETSEVSYSRNNDQRRQTYKPIQASKFVKYNSLTCKNLSKFLINL